MSVSLLFAKDPSGKPVAIKCTEDGELLIEGAVGSGSNGNTTTTLSPAIQIVTITQANTEYSIFLEDIKLLEIYCRNSAAVRYHFESGKVASSNEYRTLPSGASQPINLPSNYHWSGTIYFASSTPNVILEIESWA